MRFNKEEYKEFIKDEKELGFVNSLEDEIDTVNNILIALRKILEIKKEKIEINHFSIQGNRFEINTSKYIIHLLVLHNGDVCQYTVNKKTDYKGNYTRRMIFESVIDTLNKYI